MAGDDLAHHTRVDKPIVADPAPLPCKGEVSDSEQTSDAQMRPTATASDSATFGLFADFCLAGVPGLDVKSRQETINSGSPPRTAAL
ncbi:hypothetical protein ABH37_06190 [Mycobacterium haemophilum]|uniref:Uncharacterized protein n=1 Tax=Mycobacterium haemophilum TaxID=29311 RepID=A0A0I9UML6_9MYCO|nr:hypothetical protein ABH38_08665 [Mycobacterium haemophilum]KLO44006.1 hypothetical protein ABH37_06190 [Mycobacterium haemophilum]KLO49286.1 hypothetical protein ABH36_13055 [Mycobacterium haemophilum]